MISHYDLDPSLDLIYHHTLKCILSLDQAKRQKPITCILAFDLTLHKIFITCALSPLIFSSLYSFSLCQYFRPKQHLEPVAFLDGIKYLLLCSIFWANTMVLTLGMLFHLNFLNFSSHTRFSYCESVCICIHSFCTMNPHVYTLSVQWTCMYTLFLHSEPVYTT